MVYPVFTYRQSQTLAFIMMDGGRFPKIWSEVH